MTPAGRSYASGAAAVAVSTALSAGGGFISLYLLAQVLTKDELGGYAFAFNVLSLLAFVAAWGVERTIMLRVARLPPAPHDLRGRGLALRATALSGLFASLLIGLLLLATPRLVDWGALPAAGFWLPALALALIPMAISAILQAWFRANSRIAVSSLTHGAVNAARAVLLAAVLALGGGPVAVAVAVILSTGVPVFILGWLARDARTRPPAFIRFSDLRSGALVVVQKVSNYGLRILDVILVGVLASGVETAEYAVAARLAAFCGMGAEALQPTFAPRARRHFTTGDAPSAGHEYQLARAASFLLSLLIAIALVLFGSRVLNIFGDFSGAYPTMLILLASYMVASGAGMHFLYLHMQGELIGTAILRLASLGLLVAGAVLLVPVLGALGGAMALCGAVLALNAASVAYLHTRTGFAGLTFASATPTVLAAALLLIAGLWQVSAGPLALALMAVGALSLAIDGHSRTVLRMLFDLLTRRDQPR